jgi:hypothetical protein
MDRSEFCIGSELIVQVGEFVPPGTAMSDGVEPGVRGSKTGGTSRGVGNIGGE